jgi:hypothetical protein
MAKQSGSQSGSGGGARVSHVKAPKVEPIPHAVAAGRASLIGQSVYFAKGPLYSGPGYSTPVGPSSNMGQGPGANREVFRSGSQSPTPNPTPMGGGRSLFQNSPLKGRNEP